MKQMNKALITRIASVTLIVCFFLPLSECSYKNIDSNQTYTSTISGFEIFSGFFQEQKETISISDTGWFFMYTALFFGPALSFLLRPTYQSPVILLFSIPSYYVLYQHLVLVGPLVGAWLSLAAWSVLVVVNLRNIVQHLPHNQALKAQPSAAGTPQSGAP